ncbi:hypothetical protein ACG7TL_007210 [Trametes sanguinea]
MYIPVTTTETATSTPSAKVVSRATEPVTAAKPTSSSTTEASSATATEAATTVSTSETTPEATPARRGGEHRRFGLGPAAQATTETTWLPSSDGATTFHVDEHALAHDV